MFPISARALPCRTAAFLPAILVSLALSGCAGLGTPPASALKLARMNPMEADPGAIRFAVATPAFLRLREGDVTVTVRYDTGDPKTSFLEQYKPIITDETASAPGLPAQAGEGRLVVARFDQADSEAFRAVQARVKAFKAAGGEGKGSLTVGATGCRTAPVPAGPIRMSAWLRAEADEPYFALMRDVDMRKTLEKAGADAGLIPPC